MFSFKGRLRLGACIATTAVAFAAGAFAQDRNAAEVTEEAGAGRGAAIGRSAADFSSVGLPAAAGGVYQAEIFADLPRAATADAAARGGLKRQIGRAHV